MTICPLKADPVFMFHKMHPKPLNLNLQSRKNPETLVDWSKALGQRFSGKFLSEKRVIGLDINIHLFMGKWTQIYLIMQIGVCVHYRLLEQKTFEV